MKMEIYQGDLVTLTIENMNHEGQGVGKLEGLTIFVDGAITGEVASVRILSLKKTYAVGKVQNILRPSTERALPFCPVYESCGGCALQHMTYRESLRTKTELVKESLKRIGKITDVTVRDTLGMENPFHYRNKAQFPYGMRGGRPVSGLYGKGSHAIVEFLECAIQMEQNDKVRRIVDAFVAEHRVKIYEEESGKGLLRHVMVRAGYHSGEVMVVLVVNGERFPGIEDLVQNLVALMPEVKSVYLNVNKKKTNIILGEKNILVYGSPEIQDSLGGYTFGISPLSFYQVNPVQTEVLYGKAVEFAGLTGEETVFDLYCGIGTISLFLSKKAKRVYGVEVVAQAVEDARKNAKVNGVENVTFVAGEAEMLLPQMYEKGERADVVVVDPPRKGCDAQLLATIVAMAPKRVVYVSCNPSTLARDLAVLEAGGYRTVEVQPVDMFPWTKHVETVVLLSHKKSQASSPSL